MAKTYDLTEKLASNHDQLVYERIVSKSMSDILQMDAICVLSAQLSTLSKQVQSLEGQPQVRA